jgi:hypothetical protein
VGEGRYEPSTFPTFTIAESDLVWDWNANASNYKALRTSKSQASGGRAWELESSTDLAAPSFVSWTTGTVGMGGTNTSYLPVTKDGRIVQSAREAAKDDLDHLLQGLPTNAPIRVTRLRADLSRAALERDLSISASFDQSVISNVRQVTREANVPQCPVFDGCRQVGLAPRPTPPNSPPPGANPPGQEPGSGASMVALTCHAAPQTTLGSSGAAGLGLAGFVVSLVTWRRRRPGNNSRG